MTSTLNFNGHSKIRDWQPFHLTFTSLYGLKSSPNIYCFINISLPYHCCEYSQLLCLWFNRLWVLLQELATPHSFCLSVFFRNILPWSVPLMFRTRSQCHTCINKAALEMAQTRQVVLHLTSCTESYSWFLKVFRSRINHEILNFDVCTELQWMLWRWLCPILCTQVASLMCFYSIFLIIINNVWRIK